MSTCDDLEFMISFPIFERLDISDYGLYPGREDSPGLHVEFPPGLKLVLGTNGLGKTTLVSIIYRLLTGPYDISGLADSPELGSTRLTATKLSGTVRRMFAQRVVDNASTARASLHVRIGDRSVVIERRLSDLTLTRFTVNEQLLASNEEDSFQREISSMVGVWSFGDWILLLRHLVFYFEDRRALVWDPSAQRQILRMLFLPSSTAQTWTFEERAILELDSRMRNLNAAVTKEERALLKNEIKAEAGLDVRQELQSLEALQQLDTDERAKLEKESLPLETARQHARVRLLHAEQEREAQYRALERAKLMSIATRFPNQSQTARYILAQLVSDDDCIVCGNHVPSSANDYVSRIQHQQCIVCGTDLSDSEELFGDSKDIAQMISTSFADLQKSEINLTAAKEEMDLADRQYRSNISRTEDLNTAINDRSLRIDYLVGRLPPEEAAMHQQKSELMSMRTRVAELRAQLAVKRKSFAGFVEGIMRELATHSGEVKAVFDTYAEGFLLETCRLVWSPQKAQVGQGGDAIEFPAFELEMTGVDFPSPVRRSGPEQVSESQREFIDLAFRMALMGVAANGGRGSMVIDAPESSLDAVFVSRAADVLSRFAVSTFGNRLVITSNLVEGELIPSLLAKASTPEERSQRIIDLISLATPTAAVRERREEYEKVRDRLVGR